MSTYWRIDSNDDPTLGLWLNVPKDPITVDRPRDETVSDVYGRDYPVVQRATRPWGRRWQIAALLWLGLNGALTADEQFAVVEEAWEGAAGARLWVRSPDGRFNSPITLLGLTGVKSDDDDVTVTFSVVERGPAT